MCIIGIKFFTKAMEYIKKHCKYDEIFNSPYLFHIISIITNLFFQTTSINIKYIILVYVLFYITQKLFSKYNSKVQIKSNSIGNNYH